MFFLAQYWPSFPKLSSCTLLQSPSNVIFDVAEHEGASANATFVIERGILALIVINKAGGLIYNRTFGDGLNQLNTNDYLVLAGTFHG